MSVRLIVRSIAERDMAKVSQWYERRSVGLGAHFLRCADAAISLVERQPEAGPIYYQHYHRVLIPRFPFGVFYVFESETVAVLAVLHLARDPNKIQRVLDRRQGS